MSGTRSHSPKVQATEALIVAHGQPSDPGPAEAEIAALAARVELLLPGWRVRGVTLAMPGALDAALAAAATAPVVYPMFMSDGWFTATELPRRLAGRASRLLPPLGLDAALADLSAIEIADRAAERDWPISLVTLVIAAHGSGRSGNAARTTSSFAARIGRRLSLAAIRIGYVEQDPSIASAASNAGPRAICLPFFAARGGHTLDDVPEALDKVGFAGVRADPIGAHPQIASLISRRVADFATMQFPGSGRAAAKPERRLQEAWPVNVTLTAGMFFRRS
jgi:sirohydrochlorin ferrochelatase